MNKVEYLKQAFIHKHYLKKTWALAVFAVVRDTPSTETLPPYTLTQTATGFYYVDETGQLQRIEDAEPDKPLFQFTDKITVDASWPFGLTEPIETTVGRAFINMLCIIDVFNGKIPYQNKKISVPDIENIIALKLKDVPKEPNAIRDPKYIYVDEYVKFVNRLQYPTSLAQLCNYSATRKNIVPPPGVVEFRNKLLEEYGDRIKDPAALAEFETKIKAYDAAYLADDPSTGVFTSGKFVNIARRKMFLEFGADPGITPSTTVNPVPQALCEGWSTEPEHFVSMMNSLRGGSYARGMETVNGGVTAKALLRSLGVFSIVQEDCGSDLALSRTFQEEDIDRLVDRYIELGKGWQLVETLDMAKQYIGKPVKMRSPIYCQATGESFCRICIGEKLAKNPNGLALAATDVSGIILATFMARMHGKVLSTAKFDYMNDFV